MYKFWCVFIPRFFLLYFIVAIVIGYYFYPGGNHLDSSQVGYDFTRNFLSELGFYKTLSNETNFISSFFFNTAMFFNILVGIGFLSMPHLFNESKYAYIFAWVGAILMFFSCLFFALVGLSPGDIFFKAHIFFVQVAFNLVFLAYLFICLAFYFSQISKKYMIGSIVLFVISIIYAFHIGDQPVIDAIEQKELFQSTFTMKDLMLNAISQKLVIVSMNISLLMFTYGFDNFIKRRGL